MASGADCAPGIVAVPGFGACATVWQELKQSLAPRHRLIPVELPGHAGRPALQTPSLQAFARELAAEVPAPAVWMGWSLGALVALTAAALLPQQVRAVIAVAMGPKFVRAPDWPNALSADAVDEFRNGVDIDPTATLKRFFVLQARNRSGVEREHLKRLKSLAGCANPPPPKVLAGALDLLAASDLRAECAALRCPVLCILGSDDALVPQALAGDLKALYPGWRVEVIDGAGHVPFLSHADLFQHQLERFISTLSMTAVPVAK